jgi:hypothetical protein
MNFFYRGIAKLANIAGGISLLTLNIIISSSSSCNYIPHYTFVFHLPFCIDFVGLGR